MSPKHPHFTVRHRTLNTSRFEFQMHYSFEDCLKQLTSSTVIVDGKLNGTVVRRYYYPAQHSSIMVRQLDNSAEFELHYEEAQINGTFYPLTVDTTLFVGISRLAIEVEEPYFYLGMAAIFFTAAIALFVVASMWGLSFVLIYTAVAYIPVRFRIEKSVQNLVEILTPVWSRR
jgi:hypothetical protein